MTSKLCRTLMLLLLLTAAINSINSHAVLPSAVDSDLIAEIFGTSSNCLSPRKENGTCVSLYDCANLKYVVDQKLQDHYQYLRDSQCFGGVGQSPFVCCVPDAQPSRRSLPKRNYGRIIFPDELNSSLNVQSTTENSTTTTRTTTEASKSDEKDKEIIIAQRFKFPKPPYCGSVTISNKIYSGQDAEENEFSWMVILEYRNLTTGELIMDCSGSLINERYVLTVAHCVQGDVLKVHGRLEFVRVGDHNTDLDRFQRFRIESVTSHEGYRSKGEGNTRNRHDIALIRLARDVVFSNDLQPACLPLFSRMDELPVPTTLVVAGWGHNSFSIRTAIKQKLELPFVSHAVCRNFYRNRFYLSDEQMCAGGEFRKDSCGGDSGGPLMRIERNHWVLEGLVSFGFGCGLEKPGIYTNVRHYLDWIEQHVKP